MSPWPSFVFVPLTAAFTNQKGFAELTFAGGKDHNRGDKGRSHRGVPIEINRGPLNGSLRTHISVVLCREETL